MVCVLDETTTPCYSVSDLIYEFQQVIEKDLMLIIETKEKENLLTELQWHRDYLKEMISEQTAELEKRKEMLEDRVRFEDLISDLSSGFVNIPPDRVENNIALALHQLCQFFDADHCALLEISADRRQIQFLTLDFHEERRQELLNVADIAHRYPWAYHQIVEQIEPVVFSSLDALPPEASIDRDTWEKAGFMPFSCFRSLSGGKSRTRLACRATALSTSGR